MNLTMEKSTSSINITSPSILLRLEGLAVFVGSIALFADQGGRWWVFALLILSFDLAMLGYLSNPKLGSIIYNLGHTYILPALVMLLAVLGDSSFGLEFALIWFAHIGADRMLGFGLKYTDDFKTTHFSRV